MKRSYEFVCTVQQFPGKGGWTYAAVPQKYTLELKQKRRAWGMYPITARVGDTEWDTKLMMKTGGDFFVALNAAVRRKEGIVAGKKVKVTFTLK